VKIFADQSYNPTTQENDARFCIMPQPVADAIGGVIVHLVGNVLLLFKSRGRRELHE
jgi:hypothetical protein